MWFTTWFGANPGQTAHRLVGQGRAYPKMTNWRYSETLQIEISRDISDSKKWGWLIGWFPTQLARFNCLIVGIVQWECNEFNGKKWGCI
jgi:hypothetical protein